MVASGSHTGETIMTNHADNASANQPAAPRGPAAIDDLLTERELAAAAGGGGGAGVNPSRGSLRLLSRSA
jgi:hypothetical protein